MPLSQETSLEELHQLFLSHPHACTDTRKIQKNCIYFALKGENFNGNHFAKEALEKGAAYAVVDEITNTENPKIILVDTVLVTLQKLASYHRSKSKAKIIGITGSNGKTTTKELICAVLSRKYEVIATKGNLNNHIGVPLTLLSIKEITEIAVIEMGANHLGEIEFLSSLAKPDFGYITNFGKAHLEGFGSEKGVIKGKSELYEYLIQNNKYIFLNADDPIQKKRLLPYIKKFGFSTDDHSYTIIKYIGANPYVNMEIEGELLHSQLVGSYNFTNCAAAILIGKYFNVPLIDIKEAIESFVPDNNRSQVLLQDGHEILLDAYNANPTSMEAALEYFDKKSAPNKIVILGDMFELGHQSADEHQKLAVTVQKMKLKDAFLVGSHFYNTDTPIRKFKTYDDFAAYLTTHPPEKSAILIKGSRGMALERVLEIL